MKNRFTWGSAFFGFPEPEQKPLENKPNIETILPTSGIAVSQPRPQLDKPLPKAEIRPII